MGFISLHEFIPYGKVFTKESFEKAKIKFYKRQELKDKLKKIEDEDNKSEKEVDDADSSRQKGITKSK